MSHDSVDAMLRTARAMTLVEMIQGGDWLARLRRNQQIRLSVLGRAEAARRRSHQQRLPPAFRKELSERVDVIQLGEKP